MGSFIHQLEEIIKHRQSHPSEGSYTTSLLNQGLDRILRKIGEESGELIIAAKNRDSQEIKEECADLIYHVLVMLVDQNISIHEVETLLSERHTPN